MKVQNTGRRPVWVDGIKIMPGKIQEIPDKFKDKIRGLTLKIIEKPKPSDYERLLKLKYIETELARALIDKFKSIENIKNATAEEIAELPGIGEKRAKFILAQLKEEEV